MQANKIDLNTEYAANWRGKEVALRVYEMRTTRTTSGTKNYAVGYLRNPETGEYSGGEKVAVEVKDVIDRLDKHEALAKERASLEAEKKAKSDAHRNLQRNAINMLAKAIGAQAVHERWKHGGEEYVEYDEYGPIVSRDSQGIEINGHALERLVAFLDKVEREVRFIDSITMPIQE